MFWKGQEKLLLNRKNVPYVCDQHYYTSFPRLVDLQGSVFSWCSSSNATARSPLLCHVLFDFVVRACLCFGVLPF